MEEAFVELQARQNGHGPPASVISAIQASISSSLAAQSSAQAASSAAAATSAAATTTTMDASSISTSVALSSSTSEDLSGTTSASSAAESTTGATAVDNTSSAGVTGAASTSPTPTSNSQSGSSAAGAAASTSGQSTSAQPDTIPTTSPSTSANNGQHSPTSLHGTYSTSDPTVGRSSSTPSLAIPAHAHHNGLSSGAMAAAAVVPILIVLFCVLGALLIRRRRRQSAQFNRDSANAAFLGGAEKYSDHRAGGFGSTAPHLPPPVVTNARNDAYFTGLDTSSTASRSQPYGESYAPSRRSEVEPPPPYLPASANSNPTASNPHSAMLSGAAAAAALKHPRSSRSLHQPAPSSNSVPQLREPSPAASSTHTFETAENFPISATTPHSDSTFLASGMAAPRPSTQSSARSITSTLYSDTASVHSARAGRMSVGAAHLVTGWRGSQPTLVTVGGGADVGQGQSADPFDDPETPVSEISDEELRRLSARD